MLGDAKKERNVGWSGSSPTLSVFATTDHCGKIVQENNKTDLITGLLKNLLLRSSNGQDTDTIRSGMQVRILHEGSAILRLFRWMLWKEALRKPILSELSGIWCVKRKVTKQHSSKQFNARVAQLVEHLVEAQSVGGSNPSPRTSFETVSDNCN